MEFGITAEEAAAIMAAGGQALGFGMRDGGPPTKIRIRKVEGDRVYIFGSGTWYPLKAIKPTATTRAAVEAVRKRNATPKETPQMPPDYAPRPAPKATVIPAPAPQGEQASLVLIASSIEVAMRKVNERRAQVAAARREVEAAEAMLQEANLAVGDAEREARTLVEKLNAATAGMALQAVG